jgi:hypothetical protein
MKITTPTKALRLKIESLGILNPEIKKSDIRRTNKKLKEVTDITDVSIQIEGNSSTKRL